MSFLKSYLSATPENQHSSSAIAYLAALDHIGDKHPLVAKKILNELDDQRNTLKLIASENYSSLTVQLAMGNLLTDKYAEGVPFRRFYAGCDNVDEIESMAVEEAKSLFGADHAYVQPHSGADANLVAFMAILFGRVQAPELEALGMNNPDAITEQQHEVIRQKMMNLKVMGMALDAGGHLTHGFRMNVSSKMMRAFSYGVDPKTHLIDYGALEKQALEVRPDIIIAGYSAYPRKINFARMREIADRVGAVLMADMAHFAGFVAGKVFTGEYNPVPYADFCTSTTHKTLRGPRGGIVLCKDKWKEFVDKGCPMILGGPLEHVIAAKAVAFKEANRPEFQTYAQSVCDNARSLAEHLVSKGVEVTTGGTENHLIVANVTSSFGLTGRQAELVLRQAGLTLNRNMVPFDTSGAWYTSGIRLGTPAITTRGLGVIEMEEIASILVDLLKECTPGETRAKVNIKTGAVERAKVRVKELLSSFPLYPELVTP